MNHFPKHKPATLDERRPCAREDLYSGNFDANGKMTNWEGVEDARGRQSKTPEEVSEKILSRLYARLEVANGIRKQRNRDTNKQVSLDPKITKNLIANVLRLSRQSRSEVFRQTVIAQVRELRIGFQDAQNKI